MMKHNYHGAMIPAFQESCGIHSSLPLVSKLVMWPLGSKKIFGVFWTVCHMHAETPKNAIKKGDVGGRVFHFFFQKFQIGVLENNFLQLFREAEF